VTRRRQLPAGPNDQAVAVGLAIAGMGPIAVAGALVPIRDHIDTANIALVFVVVVVLAAASGGRWVGVTAAAVSALSFDFFLPRPYHSLTIEQGDDIVTTLLLGLVGLIVGEIVVWAYGSRRAAARGRDEIDRLHRVAEQLASDAGVDVIRITVQNELSTMLSLRDCFFEKPPFGDPLPRMERNGSIRVPRHRFVRGGFALPAGGIEIPVLGRGRQLGRLVLTPDPDVGVSIEERVVAIALSDQLGAALAADRPNHTNNGVTL
jgi:hypothetical protein